MGVSNVNQFVKRLNGIWMGSYKLRVNTAKYGRKEIDDRDKQQASVHQQPKLKSVVVKPQKLRSVVISKDERLKDERSFADIVKGEKKKGKLEGESKTEDNKKDEDGKEELVEEEEDCFEIRVIPNEEDGEMTKKMLIGEVKSFDLLQNIFDMPRVEGLFNIKLNFIGGMFVSLEFEKEESAVEFLEKAKSVWNNWFVKLFKWQDNFKISSRLASLTIFGIPLHIWNSDVAEEIARLWGTPVCLYNEEKTGFNKETRRVGILTSEEPWIDDHVMVNVQGKRYKVRVVEDPTRSFRMAPCCSKLENGHSSDEDWWDTDNEENRDEEKMEESDVFKIWEPHEDNEIFQSGNQQA
ncbi:hypothetical protein L1887_02254 [Cichorium endivia]|nr:hypothetical protein L1887_02254 [Cichorium endivia]